MITAPELLQITSLIDLLNDNFSPPECEISVEASLTDSNGEVLGRLEYSRGATEGYVFYPRP